MKQFVALPFVFVFTAALLLQSASAHPVLKKELGEKYKVEIKSCKVCHVPKKSKKERNDFGKLFDGHAEFMGGAFAARRMAAMAVDDAAVAKVDQEMVEAFKKAIVDIEKMESTKNGPTYGELIKNRKMEYLEELKEEK